MLKLHKQLVREYRQNLKVQDEKQREVEAIEAKVIEVQLMRFGQTGLRSPKSLSFKFSLFFVVNLEDLDKAELDGAAEDLRAEISDLERQQQRQLKKWEVLFLYLVSASYRPH